MTERRRSLAVAFCFVAGATSIVLCPSEVSLIALAFQLTGVVCFSLGFAFARPVSGIRDYVPPASRSPGRE